jgi:hypothetical protein
MKILFAQIFAISQVMNRGRIFTNRTRKLLSQISCCASQGSRGLAEPVDPRPQAHEVREVVEEPDYVAHGSVEIETFLQVV